MTPADELRAAAERLRPSSPSVAELTVAIRFSPEVADAFAALLEDIGDQLDALPFPVTHAPALAVARAILGTPDTTP
ncbi:hypothetical protein QBA54_07555 [Streptomyces sp. B21-108]|uniref:hypothetical protein n=1 Tax=Streptomyces sp. B21-108 TaxID=3039419 RepID=UPI002FF32222